jgi:hypothetical protein
LAGIDTSVHESGQFKGTQMHMSKRGSPYLRLAVWQAASMSVLHNEELKAYYHKKRAESKAHGVAIGAVCRKLLIRIYVILQENRPYVVRESTPASPWTVTLTCFGMAPGAMTPNSDGSFNQIPLYHRTRKGWIVTPM